MNGLTAKQLEWIIREVMRRLTAETVAATPIAAETTTHVQLDEPVVSLAQITRLGAQTTHVTVPRRSIVTPAVQDELRSRNIRLCRGEPHAGALSATGHRWWMVATCPAFARHRVHLPAAEKWLDATDLSGAVRELVRLMGTDQDSCLFFTSQVARAACELNRHPQLRAIVARDPVCLARDAEGTNANVLVVEIEATEDRRRAWMEYFFAFRTGTR